MVKVNRVSYTKLKLVTIWKLVVQYFKLKVLTSTTYRICLLLTEVFKAKALKGSNIGMTSLQTLNPQVTLTISRLMKKKIKNITKVHKNKLVKVARFAIAQMPMLLLYHVAMWLPALSVHKDAISVLFAEHLTTTLWSSIDSEYWIN